MMGAPFTAGSAEAGETVASFTAYEGAQKAVSALIAGDIPAKEIAIVGQGLRSIERITGKLGYAAAARTGALNGLVLGVLFAFIFVLGSPTVAIQAFVGVLLVGIAFGMLLSIVMYSFVRRRRDYASVMQVVADHYDVRVASSSVHKARAVMSGINAAPAAPPAAPQTPAAPPAPAARPQTPPAAPDAPAAPPRYGERVSAANQAAASAPAAPAAPAPTPDASQQPPRYGERVAPAGVAPAAPSTQPTPEAEDAPSSEDAETSASGAPDEPGTPSASGNETSSDPKA